MGFVMVRPEWHHGDGKDVPVQNMIITLPGPLRRFVDEQIAQGRYGSVGEYVLELIRADEKRAAEGHLEALLLEGLEGEEEVFAPEDWQAIRREAQDQAKKASVSRA